MNLSYLQASTLRYHRSALWCRQDAGGDHGCLYDSEVLHCSLHEQRERDAVEATVPTMEYHKGFFDFRFHRRSKRKGEILRINQFTFPERPRS